MTATGSRSHGRGRAGRDARPGEDAATRSHAKQPNPSRGEIPRLALRPDEAAAALGVSRDFFDQHVLPELRVVRRGRCRLIPLETLARWLAEAAERPLERL